MAMFIRRVLKSAGVAVVLALVAVACGASGQGESGGVAPGPSEEGALSRPPVTRDAPAIPTPRPPELLGLGLALVAGDLPNELAFRIDADPTASEAGVFVFGTGGEAGLETLAGSVAVPDANEPVVPTDGANDPAGVVQPEPDPLPTPPAVATAGAPQYPDPSPAILAASGRPLQLFELTAPDGSALAGTTRGVSAQSITVAGLASLTLAGSEFRADVCLGAQARFEQANSQGELTRSINFDRCYDDAVQADLGAGLAAALASEEVFAVVPLASPAFWSQDLLRDERVPYIGDEALPGFCGRATTLGFGTRGAQACPVLEARGYVVLAEPVLSAYNAAVQGSTPSSIAYLVENGPRGQAVIAARSFEAELVGLLSPDFLPVLPSAAEGALLSWGGVVSETLDVGPEVVMVEGGATAGLAKALRSSGFEGEFVQVGQFDPLLLVDTEARLSVAPATVISPGLDLATRRGPGWESLRGAAAAVGLEEEQIGLDFVDGYVAADMFVAAAAATSEPFTVEAFANTINSGWWYPGIEGVACGGWWPAGHFATTPCVSVSRIEVFGEALTPVLGLVEIEPQLRFELGE